MYLAHGVCPKLTLTVWSLHQFYQPELSLKIIRHQWYWKNEFYAGIWSNNCPHMYGCTCIMWVIVLWSQWLKFYTFRICFKLQKGKDNQHKDPFLPAIFLASYILIYDILSWRHFWWFQPYCVCRCWIHT